MGELVPIGLTEILPGDTLQQATSCLLRVSPLLAPVMHPVHARIHHWFVPHRIVWEDWESFITGGPDGEDASVHPFIEFGEGGVAEGSLADYLGCPPIADYETRRVNALPFRGYSLIWNEWYRDQDLQDPLPISLLSGQDEDTNTDLQNVAWEKDYFTSARPWTQKGPDVNIPFSGAAEVLSNSLQPTFNQSTGATNVPLRYEQIGTEYAFQLPTGDAAAGDLTFGDQTGLFADLSSATAINVNALREAFALQRYQEARARYGSRYTEYLRYLGVKSSDARLQRPEYLGGGKQTIQFSEVLQTGPDAGDDGVANMYGHGIAAMRSNRYRRFFEEHGYVFSFLSVKPRTMYAQGLSRTWSRTTKEDYFQRELQHIGQQEVFNRELYLAGASPNAVFGYQDRYDEYRRTESTIAGDFQGMLNFWHFARQFGAAPALNADFVKCVPPETPFGVPSEDVLLIMANHSIQARRLVAPVGSSYIY